MPQYFYKCDCGHGFSEFRPCSQSSARPACQKCGERTERDFVGEAYGVAHKPGNWPMKSEAMAVHPDQVGEAHADAVKRGVPTEFDKSGCPIFTSPGHRKRFCEAYGAYDRNGSYGDPRRGLNGRRG